MKYFFTLLLFVLFTIPSFANGKNPLTLSRYLAQDIAQKSLADFTAKYLVKNSALKARVDKALFSKQEELPVQGMDRARAEIAKISNNIYRAMVRQPALPAGGGYIPSFSKDSEIFIETTGLHYSDMALMLRHALNDPMERNFAGYFVQDFRELQKIALNPATGQTLDEALRTAYQQAANAKGGILIITEETPEQLQTFKGKLYRTVPAGLKDMYVMDWENGQWLSYQKSILDPLWKREKKGVDTNSELPFYGAGVVEKEGYLLVESGLVMKDSHYDPVWCVKHLIQVPQSSPWFEQLKYANEKGYYILIEDLPGAEPGVGEDELSNVTFLFARQRGEPLFDNVYELERGL